MVFISLYQQISAEHLRLQEELQLIQEQLQHFPQGKLICARNGTRTKWYHSDGHSKNYIPKPQKEYAQQLAIKTYLLEKQKDLQKELKAIAFYLRHADSSLNSAEQMLANDSPYHPLLMEHFQLSSQEIQAWTDSPYNKNKNYPEQLIYKTCKDEYVRSKSESLIAMNLYIQKVPYRYECELKLGSITLYPDFTLRHPSTGKTFYWEHFGIMDTPEYQKNAVDKVSLYMRHGIYPQDRLIITYETKEHPLDTNHIQQLIEFNFLR